MATFKHISSKNADYGAAEAYLTFEHDEFTMKATLDENGRLIPREDYRISSLNCGGEDFAVFFLLRRTASNSAAAFCMIIVMLPFFLLAMYERHGQPLEVVAGQVIRCMFLRTKERPYQTNNFYAALERQAQAEKEVKAIVQKAKARAAGTAGGKSRGKTDRRRKA